MLNSSVLLFFFSFHFTFISIWLIVLILYFLIIYLLIFWLHFIWHSMLSFLVNQCFIDFINIHPTVTISLHVSHFFLSLCYWSGSLLASSCAYGEFWCLYTSCYPTVYHCIAVWNSALALCQYRKGGWDCKTECHIGLVR